MESSWIVLALISAVAVAFILKTIKNRRRQPEQKLPPGPKPWPIIGNLNLLGSIPHQSFHHLSQKYGEIMQLKFGKLPVVVVSSAKMAEQFLKVHDAVFASRPRLASGKHTCYNYSDVTFAPSGPYWRAARKIYITEFFSPKKLDSLEQLRYDELSGFLSRLRSQSAEKPIEIRYSISSFTLATICRMVLKEKYFVESGEKTLVDMDELLEMLNEWFVLNGAFNVGDWIPWLGFLDLQGYMKRMKVLCKKMDRMSDCMIDVHLSERGKGKDKGNSNFVDTLLQMADDPSREVEITRDSVRALILNLLEGGSDTSSVALEWALHETLKRPHIIAKAKEELDRVIGRNRLVNENDLHQLPYLNAIVTENFRLHPIATLLAPHYATEDCNVAGYHISKGTTVFINAWSIGRDPSIWESPHEFLPERHVGKEVDVFGISNFGVLPFGSGRRKCPGYNLGIKLVKTTLANLLHGFEIELDGGMRAEDITLEEHYRLATGPKQPLFVVMKPRLPDHLY